MKLGGRKLTNKNLEIVVIPRDDGDLIFKFKPVLDFSEFDELLPYPKMPIVTDAQGTRQVKDDPVHKQKVTSYLSKKMAWMFLVSISATDNLEWENIKLGDPNTWESYIDELKSAEISEVEVNMLDRAFQRVNSLSEEHLDEARNRFLVGQKTAQEQSS